MKKPLLIPEYVSEWSSTLLKKMLVPNENERIAWDELIKYVLSPDKSMTPIKLRQSLIKGNHASEEAKPVATVPERPQYFELHFS